MDHTELQNGRRAELQKVLIVLTVGALVIGASHPTAQTKNPRQLAEAAMRKADRDFNQAMADRDLARFLSFVADDAKFDASVGKDAVAKAWAAFFAPDGPTISWAPAKAESLVAGDVGYTVGTWERHAKDAQGKALVRRGQYLTVWRLEKDGVWRATFDTGSTK
jgi:ketosteroid isomerase-like protein